MAKKRTTLKKKIKLSKKKTKRSQRDPLRAVIVKVTIKWEDAYPYLEETYKYGKEVFTATKYLSMSDEQEVENFLYEIIRSNNYPTFLKNNFKKIKKLIEKEIVHRDKLYERLSKEQIVAFQAYFKDEDYFERDEANEYFKHELEKVYFDYLKAYLETGLYESRARSRNRDRKKILAEKGLD